MHRQVLPGKREGPTIDSRVLAGRFLPCRGESCLCVGLPAEDLPNGNNLVIGLNPPFGKNGSLAGDFVKQAALFRPRIMVLIVPPQTVVRVNSHVEFSESQDCNLAASELSGSRTD